MRITSKGQVTIPKEIREKAGLLPQTEVEFGIEGSIHNGPPCEASESAATAGRS